MNQLPKKYDLSQSTKERLGYYVYLLIDPRNNTTFYVGKGQGNRIHQHLNEALSENSKETNKNNRIKDIHANGKEVKLEILRHRLDTEKEAFEVESAIIDLVGKKNLTNIVSGHDAEDRGRMNLDELKIKYEAQKAEITEPMILININNQFRRDMTYKELYEATRKYWKVNLDRAVKARLICSVYRGIIREVYILKEWQIAKDYDGRKLFIGKIAPDILRDQYRFKSVASYWSKRGGINPIRYVHC